MIDTAIILAAGRGSRMGEITNTTPKPMLKVRSKPLMEYVVNLLVAHGVKKIGVNLCYKGEEISSYFGDGARFGAEIHYTQEAALSGTAGGVLKVAHALALNKPFFVLSSDMLVNFNLTELSASHGRYGGIATLSCYLRPRDQVKKSGVILFNEKTHEILQFVERPKDDAAIISQWVNSSVYVFSPEILPIISEVAKSLEVIDLPKDIFPKILTSDKKLYAHPFSGDTYYQLGIDTPDRILRAERDIDAGVFKPCSP